MKRRQKNRKGSNSRSKSWEDRESRDMKRDDKRRIDERSTNDPSWYAADPSLLRDAASFPFSQPIGSSLALSETVSGKAQIPGVCTIRLTPTIGTAVAPNSPVNIAATSIYSFIRHANSGHANYDAPDLMIYLLAMSNIYGAINWAQRIYGLTTLYAQRNAYLPRAVLTCQGINLDSIASNMANYRMALNVIINKVSSLAVPGNMTLFNRIAFLYKNIYSEGASIKDQLYMYVPNGFYQFVLDGDTQVGKLVLNPTPATPDDNPLTTNLWDWEHIINYINTLVNSVWGEEDFGIMSGDIMRAYGDNIIKLTSLDEFYPIVPIIDEMVLEQMHNTKVFGDIPSQPVIKQDSTGSYLTTDLVLDLTGASNRGKSRYLAFLKRNDILSLPVEAPTPEMVMEATRLMPYLIRNASDTYYLGGGTEIATEVDYWWGDETGLLRRHIERWNAYIVVQNTTPVANASFRTLVTRSSFKYAPITYNYTEYSEDDASSYIMKMDVVGNVDNFTLLSNHDRDKLHTAAVLNMLNVPSIAKNAISSR